MSEHEKRHEDEVWRVLSAPKVTSETRAFGQEAFAALLESYRQEVERLTRERDNERRWRAEADAELDAARFAKADALKERDDARAIHAANVEAGARVSKAFDEAGVGNPQDGVLTRALALLKLFDEARSDNAALLADAKATCFAMGMYNAFIAEAPPGVQHHFSGILPLTEEAWKARERLMDESRSHPGAALLREVEALRRSVEAAEVERDEARQERDDLRAQLDAIRGGQ